MPGDPYENLPPELAAEVEEAFDKLPPLRPGVSVPPPVPERKIEEVMDMAVQALRLAVRVRTEGTPEQLAQVQRWADENISLEGFIAKTKEYMGWD